MTMNLTFRQMLVLPLLLSWLCLLAVVSYDTIHMRSMRLEERKVLMVSAADMAVAVAKDCDAQAAAGKLSPDQARQQALARIKALRFGASGYFTVLDSRTVLMHPIKPALIGTAVAAMKDPNGAQVYIDALQAAAQAGGGFTAYLWAKPGEQQPISKLAYSTTYKPWDWTMMTGLYMDDLDALSRADLYRSLGLLAVVGLVLITVSALAVRRIERLIGGEPMLAAQAAQRIATGDLTVDLPLRANDTRSLMFRIEKMRAQLASIVHQVRTGTEAIASASGEIAAGNQDLSARTEHQAGALQQTASSMEQLTATIQRNADSASHASALAVAASETAMRGGSAVGKVVQTMSDIDKSSRRIVDIIGVINGISFQTNILALNAAVEAARAGEQGRGFAVVAAEVRTLAQRSATAAKEIQTLITESFERVQTGTALVQQAGVTMDEVVTSVSRVTDIIGQISLSGREQRTGIEQVNDAVSSMDQTTQQNAALVEQAAAAAHSLQRQTDSLVRLVSVFKVTA
jgi:methyl-accepting chemotaxis protein